MEMSYLKKKLDVWNLKLSSYQEKQFLAYFQLLIEWNAKMNLTGITEFYEVCDKHFLDSIAMCQVYDFTRKEEISLIDVGTGAGFPGIPLKIMFPELKLTLLDSLQKRIRFLDAVVSTLDLANVELIHGRAEDIARDDVYREKFDVATSRAVANLSSLSEICLPFVKNQGVFISYKTEKAEEEIINSIHALELLNGKIDDVIFYVLPNTELSRSLVVIHKEGLTKNKYPRKAGVPFKKPLV